jgi:CRISPR-associated endonuclease/helicase Cas3
VRVSWRADLAEPDSENAVDKEAWQEVVATIPPRSEEELDLPLAAVRAWLRRQPPVALADDEIPISNDSGRINQQPQRPALRIGKNDERPAIVQQGQLMPADRIVVPATYGSLDEFGWAPASAAPVLDIADAIASRRPVIRLNQATLLPVVRQVIDEEHAKRGRYPHLAVQPRTDSPYRTWCRCSQLGAARRSRGLPLTGDQPTEPRYPPHRRPLSRSK